MIEEAVGIRLDLDLIDRLSDRRHTDENQAIALTVEAEHNTRPHPR